MQDVPHQADRVHRQRRQHVIIPRNRVGHVAKSELAFG
jgi:hypothetical protein